MYQTPRNRQQLDRDEQRNTVAVIAANMRTKFSAQPKVRTVWNECLQRYVEMR